METVLVGLKVPPVKLGEIVDGQIRAVDFSVLCGTGLCVVVGIPGAFTPVCSQQHLPDFIANADALKATGYTNLFCISPNDPFTLAAWAKLLDPTKTLRYLSDGNLELTRTLGLQEINRELFLGERSKRYVMVIEKGVITRVKIEPVLTSYSCTGPDAVRALAG